MLCLCESSAIQKINVNTRYDKGTYASVWEMDRNVIVNAKLTKSLEPEKNVNDKIEIKLPRKGNTHKAQPSHGTESRSNEN